MTGLETYPAVLFTETRGDLGGLRLSPFYQTLRRHKGSADKDGIGVTYTRTAGQSAVASLRLLEFREAAAPVESSPAPNLKGN